MHHVMSVNRKTAGKVSALISQSNVDSKEKEEEVTVVFVFVC